MRLLLGSPSRISSHSHSGIFTSLSVVQVQP
ncbi:Uncharacterised protein [Vibrio cholerae]|nr:Uncharacterised protein [Vibrio cholerae]